MLGAPAWPDQRHNTPPPQGNHIYTSGATGTNAAVIKGALRADAGDLLTVILPQSRSKQPAESQDLLEQVRACVCVCVCVCVCAGAGVGVLSLGRMWVSSASRARSPPRTHAPRTQVKHVVEMPHNDELSLMDASRCA